MRAWGFGAWVWRAPCLGLGARASDYLMTKGVELREPILKEAAKLCKLSGLTLRQP